MSPDGLRILMTCDWYDPETGGGAERVAYEVGRRLAGRGHRVAVLATLGPSRRPFQAVDGMTLVGVPSYSLAKLLHAQVSVSPGLIRTARRQLARERPDVIWAHSLQFQTTAVSAAWARHFGVPLVVTAHIGSLAGVPGAVGAAARLHEATVGRLILRSATRVAAVSGPVADHLRSLAPGVIVDVVPNGVDLDRFRPSLRQRTDPFRVGFIGRLVPNKGPDTAVRAVAELLAMGVDAELAIAGEGPEEGRLRRLATSLGISDRVRFDGFQADPVAWLGEVDAVVRPSLTEGMPLGILEAMACGVPVVASDIAPNASLVRATGGGLLAPAGDGSAFGRALAALAGDAPAYERLRSSGIVAAAGFSWERTCALTEQTLLAAAEQRGPARRREPGGRIRRTRAQ